VHDKSSIDIECLKDAKAMIIHSLSITKSVKELCDWSKFKFRHDKDPCVVLG